MPNLIKLRRNLFEGDFPLTQGFGQHPEWYAVFGLKGHNGIDYATPTGTKLFSSINGTVIENAYDKGGYGNYIKIENDYCGVIYAHMKTLSPLKVGSNVKAGDVVGISGNTGNSTGSHLHFGVFPKPRNRDNGYAGYIDPFDKSLVEWVDDLDVPASTDEILVLRNALKVSEENKDMYKSRWEQLKKDNKKITGERDDALSNYGKLKDLMEDSLKEDQDIKNEAIKQARSQYEPLVKELRIEIERLTNKDFTLEEIVQILKNYGSKSWKSLLIKK